MTREEFYEFYENVCKDHEMKFNVRSFNCLLRGIGHIRYLKQGEPGYIPGAKDMDDLTILSMLTDNDIFNFRNMGKQSFQQAKIIKDEACKYVRNEFHPEAINHMLRITVCGSMKNKSLFPFVERLLTEKFANRGVIIFFPILWQEDNQTRSMMSADLKIELHREKIRESDAILVCDGLTPETAYYGLHTGNEINYAKEIHIPVLYLSKILKLEWNS